MLSTVVIVIIVLVASWLAAAYIAHTTHGDMKPRTARLLKSASLVAMLVALGCAIWLTGDGWQWQHFPVQLLAVAWFAIIVATPAIFWCSN